jgi:hypothetical protein
VAYGVQRDSQATTSRHTHSLQGGGVMGGGGRVYGHRAILWRKYGIAQLLQSAGRFKSTAHYTQVHQVQWTPER